MPEDPTREELKSRVQRLESELAAQVRFHNISRVLFKISDAIKTTSDLDELYQAIHSALSAVIDTTNFYISLYDAATDSISFPYFIDSVDACYPPGIEVSRTESLTAEVIRTGQPLLIVKTDMVRRRQPTRYSVPECTPAEVWLGAPLKIPDAIIGVMAVQSYTDRNRYDATDMDVLTAVADQVAMAIACKRTEQALLGSQARLKALSQASFEAIFLSENGRCLDQNQAAEKRFGYTQAEAIGRLATDWIAPEDRDLVKDNMRTGYEKPYEVKALCKDGTTFSCEIQARMIEHQQGSIRVTALRDISERKMVEAALRESEDKMRSIFRAAPAGIGLVSNRILLEVNDQVCEMTGYSSDELIGKNARILYPDDEEYEFVGREKYRQITKRGTGTVETRFRRKDGRIINVLMSSTPLAPANLAAGVTFTALDITERIQAEKALRESEEKFRTLVEKSPFGISLIGKDGRYKYINPQFSAIFGYTSEDIALGREWFVKAFPDKEYRRMVIRTWIDDQRRIEIGLSRPRTYTVTCKNGSRKEIHFLPFTMENLDQFVIYEDVTEKSKLERQLQQARKFEAIGTLAGGVAHDFNNLLMGIQGRSSLMSMELDHAHPHMEHVNAIGEYIRSATDLTKQLLGFARGGKYEVKPIDISQLVLNSASMFGRTRKEIKIHTKNQTSSLVVDADRSQIEQVLLNLYVNAWQAMPDGGDLYLEIKAVRLDDDYCRPYHLRPGPYARVSVTDTGTGMDESTRLQVFDPFFTTKQKSRGTGLGLASAYGIIKNHGGLITIYSEVGHGTTFNFHLPLSEKEIQQEVAAQWNMTEGSETILLVDDEDMIIQVGRAMLAKLGYRVIVTSNGLDAVEKVRSMGGKIDLVVLDMIMPGIDGGKTFERIREIQPEMRVMLSSGYAINGKATEILRRGCNGFIQKPFNISELSEKVRQVLDAAGGSGKQSKDQP